MSARRPPATPSSNPTHQERTEFVNVDLTEGRWWDSGSWWRWRLIRPLAWRLAGARDRAATLRARRRQDVIR